MVRTKFAALLLETLAVISTIQLTNGTSYFLLCQSRLSSRQNYRLMYEILVVVHCHANVSTSGNFSIYFSPALPRLKYYSCRTRILIRITKREPTQNATNPCAVDWRMDLPKTPLIKPVAGAITGSATHQNELLIICSSILRRRIRLVC